MFHRVRARVGSLDLIPPRVWLVIERRSTCSGPRDPVDHEIGKPFRVHTRGDGEVALAGLQRPAGPVAVSDWSRRLFSCLDERVTEDWLLETSEEPGWIMRRQGP